VLKVVQTPQWESQFPQETCFNSGFGFLQVPPSGGMSHPYTSVQQFPTSSLPLSLQGLPPQYAQMLAQQHSSMSGMAAGFPFLQGEIRSSLAFGDQSLTLVNDCRGLLGRARSRKHPSCA